MTRLFRVAALIAALMLAAATPALATRGQPDRQVPFGFTGTTADSSGPPTCPGAVWQFFSYGLVEVTHLGLATLEVTHCSWFDSPTTGHFGPGTATFTAANGDTLTLLQSGTFETVVTPDSFLSFVNLEWEVSDGTGRFDGAVGSGHGTLVGDILGGTSTGTYWGTIAYDASGGSGD